MLDAITPAFSAAPRLTIAEARSGLWADDAAMRTLLGWIESYLMRGHADLGRAGAVCPFTKQAGKIDAMRVAVSHAGATDEDEVFALIRRSFAELGSIPCKAGMEVFRTIIIGFPNCDTADARAMLARVQQRHKYHSLSRFRMIGYMYADNDAPGLWNPAFRPLRAPMPVLAIRYMVEQDAPFAARHPLLLVPYLAKFKLAGVRALWKLWRK